MRGSPFDAARLHKSDVQTKQLCKRVHCAKMRALGHAAHKTHPQETSRHTDLQKISVLCRKDSCILIDPVAMFFQEKECSAEDPPRSTCFRGGHHCNLSEGSVHQHFVGLLPWGKVKAVEGTG